MVGICVLMSVLFVPLSARQVLVAVELTNTEHVQQWLKQDIPTYYFMDNTAIAELDDAKLQDLRGHGFYPSIIDESPWQETYYVGSIPERMETTLPGTVVWQKNRHCLVEVPKNEVAQLRSLGLYFQPLTKHVLPERFWSQVLNKTVPIRAISWDPIIQNIVDQVSTDSLTAYIQRLQDFRTRLLLTDSSYAASEWLRQKLNTWGYTAEFDSFYIDHGWPGVGYERNVIARANGTIDPSRIYIVCGHFDAMTDSALARYFAPGADDNGSGTAVALEAARILTNYSLEPTIEFIPWACEEYGLQGSHHYAYTADSLGLNIAGVVNCDMVGYMDDEFIDCMIQDHGSFTYWLSDLFYQAGQLYAPELILYQETWQGGSDDYSFLLFGFPSVCVIERWWDNNPYYHDTTDLLINLSPEFYTASAKAAVATMAILGLYPDIVHDVVALDIGDGTSLLIQWSSSTVPDIIGYNVYWSRESEVYTDTHYIAGAGTTVDTLTALLTDSTYYIAVTAVDSDDYESYGAIEVTGVPRTAPRAPQGVVATPIVSGIRIDWQPNRELDIAGYRVYRRINDNPVYDSLNTVLLKDTTYTNAPLSGADKYYYTIRAFDRDGNFSVMSDEAYGRPITLDQGILLVDETRNGTNPPDSLQDAFYHAILDGYTYTDYEFDALSKQPVFADLAPYSTVVWHADDYSEVMASGSIPALRDYLETGGNLWFMGWQPLYNLAGQHPMDFGAGDFVYDYLKISHAERSTLSDSFQAAAGVLGYPQLDIDSAKVPIGAWHGTLRYIEALTTVSPAEDIYTIDMKNNTSPFEGEICGVRYLGSDYRMAFFSFPLYYMHEEQARAVALKVMDDLGEVGIAEQPTYKTEIMAVRLYQNLPNPFVSKTLITYEIPGQGFVSLKIYNSVGQLVKTLVNEPQSPGVYRIGWESLDDQNRRVSSGIYFCKLTCDDQHSVGKMILLR